MHFASLAAVLIPIGLLWRVALQARRERLRERRHENGECPGCGYDLRASAHRCPECGRPINLQPEAEELRALTPVVMRLPHAGEVLEEAYATADGFEAQVFADRLGHAGINCHIERSPRSAGAVALMVWSNDVPLAKELIEIYRTRVPERKDQCARVLSEIEK